MKAITPFLLKVKLRCAMFGICIWQESPHGLTELNERDREVAGGGGGQRETEILLRACISPESSHSTDRIIHSPSGWRSGERTGHLECSGPPSLPLSSPLSRLLTFHSGGIQAGHGRIHFLVFFSCWNKCQSLHSSLWRESNTLPCGMGEPGSHSVTLQSLQGPLATWPPLLGIRCHRTKAEQGTDGNSSLQVTPSTTQLPRRSVSTQLVSPWWQTVLQALNKQQTVLQSWMW